MKNSKMKINYGKEKTGRFNGKRLANRDLENLLSTFIYAVHLHSTLSEMLCTVIKPGCPVVDAQANVILLVIF